MGTTVLADGKIRRDDSDGIITVTLTRDEKVNAIDTEMMDVITRAAEYLADDAESKVLVITAEGRYFTAGVDMKEAADSVPDYAPGTAAFRRYYRRDGGRHDLFDFFEQIEKPVVVAMQGHAIGWAIEMAVSCDFRLAAEGVRLTLPETTVRDLLPASGGISRLTRLVGPHWARWMLVGQPVTAEEARMMGLVHAVYPVETFTQQVREFALHLAALPIEALGLGMMAIDAAVHADRRLARDIDRLAQSIITTSEEFKVRQQARVAGNT